MLTTLNQDTSKSLRYKAIQEHLCCDLNNEAVILSLENGKYYGMNPVGARIWELLQNSATLPEIEQTLLSEYDVDEEMCREEIASFLEQMIAEGLIKTKYAASTAEIS